MGFFSKIKDSFKSLDRSARSLRDGGAVAVTKALKGDLSGSVQAATRGAHNSVVHNLKAGHQLGGAVAPVAGTVVGGVLGGAAGAYLGNRLGREVGQDMGRYDQMFDKMLIQDSEQSPANSALERGGNPFSGSSSSDGTRFTNGSGINQNTSVVPDLRNPNTWQPGIGMNIDGFPPQPSTGSESDQNTSVVPDLRNPNTWQPGIGMNIHGFPPQPSTGAPPSDRTPVNNGSRSSRKPRPYTPADPSRYVPTEGGVLIRPAGSQATQSPAPVSYYSEAH